MASCFQRLLLINFLILSAANATPLVATPSTLVPQESQVFELSRSKYADQLEGFWLGSCIANWTGLVTEMDKIGDTPKYKTGPFYTRHDWGQPDQPSIWSEQPSDLSPTIDFVLRGKGQVWGADDDTDIEYMYQHLLASQKTTRLSPEQIRQGWLKHIRSEEENFLWVSNERAFRLMEEGVLPPMTSEPEQNSEFEMIDAQLTTEIFGFFAPGRPDIAVKLAKLPIQTTARQDAAWISEFYVRMYSLASLYDPNTSLQKHLMWSAEQASVSLPEGSYSRAMYEYVKKLHASGMTWEAARDAIHQRYQVEHADGYDMSQKIGNGCFAAGINFAASLVSLFYGEGDFRKTLQIGTLAGWDSDNPTATWGGLLGFIYGRKKIERIFPEPLSDRYEIHRTRQNFPQGIDDFTSMAQVGLGIVDRVVVQEMDGKIDQQRWLIPLH